MPAQDVTFMRRTALNIAGALRRWIPVGHSSAGLVERLRGRIRSPENFGPELRTLRASRPNVRPLSVRTIAAFVGLLGLLDLLSALTPPLASRLDLLSRALPLVLQEGARLASAVSGFALAVLAVGLWKGRRVARWITLMVLAVSVSAHMAKGLDYEEATLSVVAGLWLWSLRDDFVARSDPVSLARALRLSLAAIGFTLVYSTLGFWLLEQHYGTRFDLRASIEQTLVMFTQFRDPGLLPLTGFGRYFANSIYLVAFASLVFGLSLTLRPVLAREPAPGGERERARAIFQAHGRSSISPAALLPDKRYCFSEGGSVVAYVVRNGVALALAEPIGPELDIDEAIASFHELCAGQGWVPAWYEAGPEQLKRFRDFGYKAICLGHEAVIDLRAFSLEGSRRKDLRGKFRRVERDGYSSRIHIPPHPAALLDELAEVSDEWLLRAKGREKSFTLGWFDRDYLNEGPLMVVHDTDDRPMAFVNVKTLPRMNEASIDLMRHRQEIEKNTMLFLFTSLMLWAQEEGFERFNMGMAPLYGVGDKVGDPALDRALHMVYERGGRLYGFKGLQFFKSQFRPDWAPRYLIHPGFRSLPAVAVAIVSAISGDDFAQEAMRGVIPTERLASIVGRRGEAEAVPVAGPSAEASEESIAKANDVPENPAP